MSGGGLVDVPWMARFTDLINRINQCVLIVGLERNVEIDSGTRGRVAMVLPVRWDGVPRVLDVHVVPRW